MSYSNPLRLTFLNSLILMSAGFTEFLRSLIYPDLTNAGYSSLVLLLGLIIFRFSILWAKKERDKW